MSMYGKNHYNTVISLQLKKKKKKNCGAGENSESPLESKEIKPVILKEINSKYSLEGLMLKVKLQYFGHLM